MEKSWAFQGHAIRRVSGSPSSHLDAAGPAPANGLRTSAEAYEEARAAGSARIPGAGPKPRGMAVQKVDYPPETASTMLGGRRIPNGSDREDFGNATAMPENYGDHLAYIDHLRDAAERARWANR